MNHSLRLCLFPVLWGLLLVACPSTLLAQNQSIDSGDWFDDANWEDQFGNNDSPTGNDGHHVDISGNEIITINSGAAVTSPSSNLTIGDINGGTTGSGELQVLGDGSLSVSGFFDIGGNDGLQNRLLIDTTGTVSGVLRVGRFSSVESVVDVNNGTLSGGLQIGLGAGRVNLNGGTINGGPFAEPLNVIGGGVLNQTAGRLAIGSATANIRASGQYLFKGGVAEIGTLSMEGGLLEVGADASEARLEINDLQVRTLAAGSADFTPGQFNIGANGDVNVNRAFLAGRKARTTLTGGSISAAGSVGDLIVDGGIFETNAGEVTTERNLLVQEGSLTEQSQVNFTNGTIVDAGGVIGVGLSGGGNAAVNASDGVGISAEQIQVGNAGRTAIFNANDSLIQSTAVSVGNGATNSSLSITNSDLFADSIIIGRLSEADALFDGETDVLMNFLDLGEAAGSRGEANIDDTAILNSQQIVVGDEGVGILRLNDQSETTTENTFVGAGTRGAGLLAIKQEASFMNTGSMSLGHGDLSNGRFDVEDDATAVVEGFVLVANQQHNSVGTINVRDNATFEIEEDLFVGASIGTATVNVESLTDTSKLEVLGDAFFGGTESTTKLNISGGEFIARNLNFDGVNPDTTDNQLNQTGGVITTVENLEFQRGIAATISDGVIDVGQDLVVGNDQTPDDASVVIDQTGGLIAVTRNLEFVADGESTWNFQDGELIVGGNANLGTGVSDDAGFGTLDQSGGDIRVVGDLNNVGLFHRQTGGILVVEGDLKVGDEDDQTFAAFELEGGQVGVGRNFEVANDEVAIRAGELAVIGNIVVGSLSNLDSGAELAIDAGSVEASSLIINSVGSSGINVDLNGGALTTNRIEVNSVGGADATFTQFDGELKTDQIVVNGNFSTFGMLGGSLESKSQPLSLQGDLFIAGEGELRFKKDEVFEVSGQFVNFDASLFGVPSQFPAGVFNLSQVGSLRGEEGFLALIEVGDASNLGGGELDLIHLIEGFDGTRLTEGNFESLFAAGNLGERAFALVEGTEFGNAGFIGIAFANFSSVPEPGSGIVVFAGATFFFLRRRRSTC